MSSLIVKYIEFINENRYKYHTTNYDFHSDELFKDWIYGIPNKDTIKAFNRWLKENEYAYVYMYHGTDASHPILIDGLKRTKNSTKKSVQSQSGYVYLSIYPKSAKLFGELANPAAKSIAVYKVLVRIKSLLPDIDQLNNKRVWSSNLDIGNTLADSIIYGSGARVKGDISPNSISII